MAKIWIKNVTDQILIRRSHITSLYIDTGKTEADRYNEAFSYFVKGLVKGETYTIAGPFKTKQEALTWMFKEFK